MKIEISGIILGIFLLSMSNVSNAGLIDITDINTLTADYTQTTVANFSGLTSGSTFSGADFGALNGTGTTTDASIDNATFKFTISNLSSFSGTTDQYMFEAGGGGFGLGMVYQANDVITFGQRQNDPINTLSYDATALIGKSFDIVATFSNEDDFLRLFVDGSFAGELAISADDNDWDGGDGGAFGRANGSLFNGVGIDFNSGNLSNFNYYHDIIVTSNVPEPSTLAIFALGMIGLAARRFKKQS